MAEQLPLRKRILQMTLTQWIALVMFIASVVGYVFREEKAHEETLIKEDRSDRQIDSIIKQVGIYRIEFLDFKKSYYEHINGEKEKENKEDLRLDNIETRETKEETEFNDMLYWNKSKK